MNTRKLRFFVALPFIVMAIGALFVGNAVVGAARKAPGAVLGTEIGRRTLPAGSVVRVYVNGVLKSETAAAGDTQVTVGPSLTPPPPPPVPVLSQLSLPSQIQAGGAATGSVRLSAASSQAVSVSLSSDQPSVVSVPASVSVVAGSSAASFLLLGGIPPTNQTATITATLGTVRLAQAVEVLTTSNPPPPPPPGSEWYVSPDGKATNLGTKESPFDLESTINGTRRSALAGGGTVWLMPGVYRKSPNPEGLGFRCMVGGSTTSPLVFRAIPGGRVTLDGGWSFFNGSNNTWLRDVDVTVSDLKEGLPPFGLSGSWPEGAPNGGVSFYTSKGCKVINCRIYRNRQGINLWTEAEDAEAYGNVIYDNGWVGSDRAHGHGIYTQNPAGRRKWITDNILTHTAYSRGWPDGRYGLHGYGERVAVTDITLQGNLGAKSNDAWLLDDGAVLGPSAGHHVLDNAVYGVRFRLGSRTDQPLEFRRNIVAGELQMSTGPEVTQSGNLIAPPQARPSNDQVILRANKYEPTRAQVMLIDWSKNGRVTLDSSGWLAAGDRVRVLEPTDYWGAPVFSGAWPLQNIELPVDGARVLILQKEATAPGSSSVRIQDRVEEAPVTPSLRRR